MHQKSLPPRGKAIFLPYSRLPLGGKLSTKLTDEGQLQYRANSFLQKTSCPLITLLCKELPPRGKAIFSPYFQLPLGGKLSTKLTDEGQLQYRVNSFLQKTSCPHHHLASQGASPSGEAYIFALFLGFPLGGRLYLRRRESRLVFYISPLFSQSF